MKSIYNLLTYIYNIISTFLENKLLKKQTVSSDFLKKGYYKISNTKVLDLNYDSIPKLTINKYYKKLILSNDQLNKLINNIFIENKLIKNLTERTGFCYSIDFFTAYETSSISEQDQEKGWYANHPHIDKPYSKNTIKLIVPIQKITDNDGPMKIASKEKSKNFPNINNHEFENVLCDVGDIFVFNPNLCYHYASSPNYGLTRKQMMFQLNPSAEWCVNKNIFSYQKIKEPKFPFFYYLFNPKKHLG